MKWQAVFLFTDFISFAFYIVLYVLHNSIVYGRPDIIIQF